MPTALVSAAAVALGWCFPAILLPFAARQADASSEEATRARPPSVVVVASRESEPPVAVAIAAKTTAVPTVTLTATGTVTSVGVTVGGTLRSGDRLIDVDGIPVFAYVEAVPVYRDIGINDSGTDVRSLLHFLNAAGLLAADAVDAHAGPRAVAAIKLFQSRNGFAVDGRFRKAYVAYVPSSLGAVSEVSARVGQELSGSSALLSGTATASAMTIRGGAGGVSLTQLAGASVRLKIGSNSVDISSISPNPSEIATLYRELLAGVSRGEIKPPNAATAEPASAAQQDFTGVFASSTRATQQGVVPATAVFTTARGVSCVFERTAARRATLVPRVLHTSSAASAEVGLTLVDSELIGHRVLRDASRAANRDRQRCGS